MTPLPPFMPDHRGGQIPPGQHQQRHQQPRPDNFGPGGYQDSRGVVIQTQPFVLSTQRVQPSSSVGVITTHIQTQQESLSPKRKTDDSASPPGSLRAKRTRYISLACNECKRRKIKCNGQTPCQRCGHLNLQCLYTPNCCNNFKDSEEYKELNTSISSLKQQLSNVTTGLNSVQDYLGPVLSSFSNAQAGNASMIHPLSASLGSHSAGTSRPVSAHKSRFQGPTTSAFSLGVAKSSLKHLDVGSAAESAEDSLQSKEQTPYTPPPPNSYFTAATPSHPVAKDPMWYLGMNEAVRLVRFWEEEIWVMFPLVDIEQMVSHVRTLYGLFESSRKHDLSDGSQLVRAINDDQTKLLKVIIATALTLDGNGKTELGILFSQHVERSVQEAVTAASDLQIIRLLSAAALYYFHLHQDDESLAWRLTGLAARLCFELGLHKHETYVMSMPSSVERATANKLMWSVYILDRRWTFGTGLPFAIQDSDMDPDMLQPDKPPYLCAMVDYSKIGSKVWKWVSNCDSSRSTLAADELDKLDLEVQQWYLRLPECLKDNTSQSWELKESKIRSNKRLRVLIRLRLNQMRILIYRPILHTPSSIRNNLRRAEAVVDIAKSTVREITMLINNADIYRTQQVLFNYFLLSAVAVLVLSVCHAPSHFTSRVKDEFHMAVEFVRGFSADSIVARKLWKTLRSLKEVGQKLGVNFNSSRPQQVPSSTSGLSHSSTTRRPSASNNSLPSMMETPVSPMLTMSIAPVGPSASAILDGDLPSTDNLIDPTTVTATIDGLPGSPTSGYYLDGKSGMDGDGGSLANTIEGNFIKGIPSNGPNGMADDLAELFQAAGGFAGLFDETGGNNGYMGFPPNTGPPFSGGLALNVGLTAEGAAGSGFFGQDNELSNVLKNLF